MKWPRTFGIIDLGILTLVAVALFLPPREMFAKSNYKTEDTAFSLGLAEARTIVSANDGKAVDDFSRRLVETNSRDWAVEAAIDGSERAKDSPSQWRALLATSVAYVDRLDVVPALNYVNKAVTACELVGQQACPSWEDIRMRIYQQHLDAGVKSGINPHVDPKGFRAAGEGSIRQIRLKQSDVKDGKQ